MLRSLSRPVGALAAAATLLGLLLTTVGGTASAATSASAPTPVSPVQAGGGYLAHQLADAQDGILTSGGFPQLGETVDALLSLAAAKVASGQQGATLTVLRGQAASYVMAQDGSSTVYYPGSLAKLALAVQAEGEDPDTFTTVPLLSTLRGLECTARNTPSGCAAEDVGLYKSVDATSSDPSTTYAYDSPVTQALSLIALSRTGTAPSAAAVAWLVGQQCSDGGFSDDEKKSCTATSESVDNAAYAAQALVATGQAAAAARAGAYLTAAQASDGSLPGASGTASANSTGLAAQAFTALGDTAAASAARRYLVSVQRGCSAAAAGRGAVSAPDDGDATFATAQAVQGLASSSLMDLTASGSTTAVPALTCTVTGPTPAPSAAGPSTEPVSAELPKTGAPQVPVTVLAGLLLLLGGAALVLLGRCGGRHRA